MVLGTHSDPGLIPWSVTDLFDRLRHQASATAVASGGAVPGQKVRHSESFVRMSYFEMAASGHIKDLLDPEKDPSSMSVVYDNDSGANVCVVGITEQVVGSAEQVSANTTSYAAQDCRAQRNKRRPIMFALALIL